MPHNYQPEASPRQVFFPWTLDGIGREKLETAVYQLWVFWLAPTKFSRFLHGNPSNHGKTWTLDWPASPQDIVFRSIERKT
jgi:hypothetical protein